jgi:hypothetical protein
MGEMWFVGNELGKKEFKKHVDVLFEKHKQVTFRWNTGKTRTTKQQAAMQVYFREAAKILNEHGIYQETTSRFQSTTLEVPWTEHSFKEFWRSIQITMFNIKSTKDLQSEQVSQVYDVINKGISERVGLHIPFPHKELVNET